MLIQSKKLVRKQKTKEVITRSTLEKSLEYLVCPADKSELKLNIPNRDQITEGDYKCSKCGISYEIKSGVPYFFSAGNGFEWNSVTSEEIELSIADTVKEDNTTLKKILALGQFFLTQGKSRKDAIDSIFGIVQKVSKKSGANEKTQAFLMQAATEARYDLEIYRGTFTLPSEIMASLVSIYQPNQGIIVEGACANGECLLDINDKIANARFYLGFDISGNMVRLAQVKSKANMLFVQADVCNPPLRDGVAGVYTMNNVLDRVPNPTQACKGAAYLCNRDRSAFALSNCNPLQYEYTASDGEVVSFVPEDKRLPSLDFAMSIACFNPRAVINGIWNINTVAYGREQLPYKSILGVR
jgi:uncharacterized protein YbaR (Trm112 family)